MKHSFLLRNAAALLAAVMLLGLAGCGQPENSAPAPSQNDSVSAQSAASAETSESVQEELPAETSQSMQSEAAAETSQPGQNLPSGLPGTTSLAQLRAQALSENEHVNFAAAYLGNQEIEGVGIWPTDNATVANYDIFEDIDEAHRIDASGGADDAETYCILPIDPNAGMYVCIVDPETDEEKEEVYRSETGEPILLSCNGGGVINTKVYFTGAMDDYFWPMTSAYNGQKYLVEPNGGTGYDFTIYPSQPVGPPVNEPGGDWQAEVLQPLNDFQQITMNLSLSSLYGSAELTISDTASGDFMAGYSGNWMLLEGERFALDLTCDENVTGMKEYDAPIQGEYSYAVGTDYSLTIGVSGKDSTPFYVNHAYEPITFFPQKENTDDDEYGKEACTAVLNWYETTYDYRPGFAEVDHKEGDKILVHLYDDMGDHVATVGWYLVDPATLQGSDYMTDEKIDFSEFTTGVG